MVRTSSARSRRSKRVFTLQDVEAPEIVRLWVLRILLAGGVLQKFVDKNHGFDDEEVARWLGFGDLVDDEAGEVDILQVKARLTQMAKAVESHQPMLAVPEVLHANVRQLGGVLAFSPVECQLLEFAVLSKQYPVLSTVADYAGELTTARLTRFLAIVLEIPMTQISEALLPSSALMQSSLLRLDASHPYQFSSKVELPSRTFADGLCNTGFELTQVLRDCIVPSAEPTLTLKDYGHLQPLLDVLLPYLRLAIKQKRQGVNIFLYGPPGTGKSELVRVLAKEIESEVFEVSSEDRDGDPLSGDSRLNAYRAAQNLFGKQSNTLLLFDEVEEVFTTQSLFGFSLPNHDNKGWVNRMLERNPVPAIWLSNSVSVDKAFIRRFDIVHEIPIPPRYVRERIIQNIGEELIDARDVACMAESCSLSPAVVGRAVSVVRQVSGELKDVTPSAAVRQLIDNTLRAQGHAALSWSDAGGLPELYDPEITNTSLDIPAVVAGLQRVRSGRLCFYGPPGTGKTALGRWLAEQLGAPLHVVRASDLLSMWLGESERKIAEAFRSATQEKAVLLFDEVDSFLQDRRGAKASWEVTQVNEMLTQMEAYSGVFIASTNLMESLDEAALRRFDMKVRFGYLRPDQARRLFERHCQMLGLEISTSGIAVLKGLNKLTPGDFAAVVRRARFNPLKSADEFAEALQEECEVKRAGGGRNIGFV